MTVSQILTKPAACKMAKLPDRIVYGWPLEPVVSSAPMLVLTWKESGDMTIRLVGVNPDDVIAG